MKREIHACIPYRGGSEPTILHSDHATLGPHGCFEIMLKMTGMIMIMKMMIWMIMVKMTGMIMIMIDNDRDDHGKDDGDDRDHENDDHDRGKYDGEDHGMKLGMIMTMIGMIMIILSS